MSHPTNDLNDTVHQRVRLGILAVLVESRRAEFGYLRQALELTDGNLFRHLQVLADAKYVKVDKKIEGSRPRTWVSATKEGRTAFAEELASLRRLMSAVKQRGHA